MRYSTYRFTLDLQKHQSQMSIAVFKNDTAVRLRISLTDGGKPYLINDGCIAKFYGTRSDKEELIHNCMIESNAEIIYDFQQSTSCKEGITECQIRLYGLDGHLITAPRFIVVIDERVVIDESVEIPEDTLSGIDEMFLEEAVRKSAENDRLQAEEERKSNEIARQAYMAGMQEHMQSKKITATEKLQVGGGASIGGNLEVTGDITGNNISEITRKLDDAVLKNPQGGGTQDIKSALKALQIYTVGYANFGRDVGVTRDLSIGRNLYVKGTTYTVNQQTIIAKDNIIVTNAVSGAKNLASGLVINKGNGTAYGILYMPKGDAGDAVYIGEGKLTVTKDADDNVTDVSFEYNKDQALPLAARSAFGETENGFVPVWDSELNAFVPGNFGRENEAGLIEQFQIEHPTLDESNEKYHPHSIATVGALKDALANVGSGGGSWISLTDEEREHSNFDWVIEHKPSEILVYFCMNFNGVEYIGDLLHLIKVNDTYIGNTPIYMDYYAYEDAIGLFFGKMTIDLTDYYMYLDGPCYYHEYPLYLCNEFEAFNELDKDFKIYAYKE